MPLEKNFNYPYELIPNVRWYEYINYSSPGNDGFNMPYLLFKDVDGDKGLRYATRFFWNACQLNFSLNGVFVQGFQTDISPRKRVAAIETNFGGVGASKVVDHAIYDSPVEIIGMGLNLVAYANDIDRYVVSFGISYASGLVEYQSDLGKIWPVSVIYEPWEGGDYYLPFNSPTLPDWLEVPSNYCIAYSRSFDNAPSPTLSSLIVDVKFWEYPP